MNPSEALYYPRPYYTDIAFFSANYMTRLFSKDSMIYVFDQHDGWHGRISCIIERLLLRARLDDSVAIGALVLLERHRHLAAPKHSYPHESFLENFICAYMISHRILSQDPARQGFWSDVIGNMFSFCKLEKAEREFGRNLNRHAKISKQDFMEMKSRMYAFIRTHMILRSGGCYQRDFPSKSLDLPPCYREMVSRKVLLVNIETSVPDFRSMSDRAFYNLLFQPTYHQLES